MNKCKHICDLSYCKIHSICIFKNAESSLKNDAYIAAIGEKEYSDRIICYKKEDVNFFNEQIKEPIIEKTDTKNKNKPIRISSFKTKSVRGLIPLVNINKNTSPNKLIRCANIYCGTCENLTRHHLIPKRYRAGVPNAGRIIYLCVDCHKKVHNLKSNSELSKSYNTKQAIIELLSSDVYFRIERFISVAKQELSMVA